MSLHDEPPAKDVRLFRTVRPDQFKPASGDRELSPSSQAFQNLDGLNMSVLREDVIIEEGPTLKWILKTHFDGYGVVALTVSQVESEGQHVEPDPQGNGLECHAHVVGPKGTGCRKRLARMAQLVLPPSTR